MQTLNEALLENAYRKGWEQAVRDYAVWKDGEQLVGMGHPLEQVLAKGPDGLQVRVGLEDLIKTKCTAPVVAGLCTVHGKGCR